MPRKCTSKSLSIFRAKPRRAAKPRPAAELGALPEWNLDDLYPSMDLPAFASDLAKAAAECKAFNAAYKGKLEALAKKASGAGLLEAIRRYEALEELLGRIRPMPGSSMPAIPPIRRGEILWRRAGKNHSSLLRSAVLRARIEPARRQTRGESWRRGRSRIIGPGSKTSARASPTSSTTSSSNCSMKNRSPVMAPGTGCSTRPSRACASTSMASS